MVSKRRWSIDEISFLRENYGKVYSSFIGEKLGRSIYAVQGKARSIGLSAINLFVEDRVVKDFSPSSDLSYLIGAILGDGSVYYYLQKRPKLSPHYYITLTAKDYDFVLAVRDSIGMVVNKLPKILEFRQHKATITPGSKMYRVIISNKSLFYLLKKPLAKLKPYIEAFPCDFLRGFFDAEGSAWWVDRKNAKKRVVIKGKEYIVNRRSKEPVVKYCNTDKDLMDYVKELLIKLDIHPAPKMFICYGKLCDDPKPCYNMHIYRLDSVRRFMDVVGSSISRKILTF